MNDEIKKCPFCNRRDTEVLEKKDGRKFVHCKNCGAVAFLGIWQQERYEEIVEKENERFFNALSDIAQAIGEKR